MKPESRQEFRAELHSFHRYIRILLRRARWTQKQLAAYLKVNPATITRWLGEETLPSLRLRKKMKILDDSLRRQMSKEDEERLIDQAIAREDRRKKRLAKAALPKPERQPDQLTARVGVPVVEFEPDDEMANG